jgi:3-hydroxyisobutyrate dehydrogenase
MNIGFIGLGTMGNAMACSILSAKFPLVVHDLRKESSTNLVRGGAAWANSLRIVAEKADIVFTCLPGPKEVAAVLEAKDGLMASLRAGTVWIDMSTTDFAQTRSFADILAKKGVDALEAPVTGGSVNARNGQATIFVGGERHVYDRVAGMLGRISGKVFHMGPLGAATVTKLITNMLCFIHEAGIGEGLILGVRSGLDPVTLWEAIKASYGNSFVAENDVPHIFNGDYGSSFPMRLAYKDLLLTQDIWKGHNLKLEVAGLVEELYRRARDRYGPDSGCLSVVRMLEEDTGTVLGPKSSSSTPQSPGQALGNDASPVHRGRAEHRKDESPN